MPDPVSLVRRWTDALDESADAAAAAARALLADDAIARLPVGEFTGADSAAAALSAGRLWDFLAGLTWSEPTMDGGDVVVSATPRASSPVDGCDMRFTFGSDAHARVVAQTIRRHVHRTPVTLPDGTVVTAVSWHEDDTYGRTAAPGFGLYLDARWEPPWRCAHVDWPDFGLPADAGGLVAALTPLLDDARRGIAVEIGCLGGHGRTGTALAVLAVLAGLEGDPVAWVRETYCRAAIETPAQETFVREFSPA